MLAMQKRFDYLTFPDLWSGTLMLKIALRPGAGSLTVIVVRSWNADILTNISKMAIRI